MQQVIKIIQLYKWWYISWVSCSRRSQVWLSTKNWPVTDRVFNQSNINRKMEMPIKSAHLNNARRQITENQCNYDIPGHNYLLLIHCYETTGLVSRSAPVKKTWLQQTTKTILGILQSSTFHQADTVNQQLVLTNVHRVNHVMPLPYFQVSILVPVGSCRYMD